MSKEELRKDEDARMVQLHSLRQEYRLRSLAKADVAECPLEQFVRWLAEACESGVPEPNAMVLATVNENGEPSTRTVLLKGIVDGTFVFFTNYESRKGRELAKNPHASVTFLWKELERQVSVRGRVEKSNREDSAEYFHSRPYGSQIGALVSQQSSVVPDRKALEVSYQELVGRFQDGKSQVPLPDSWGGFRLIPAAVEFWQGRESRLHDRILYSLVERDLWKIERLSP